MSRSRVHVQLGMTVNLRASLAVFSIGFAIEGIGELYAWVTQSTQLPSAGWLLAVGPAFTVLGLLFLWIGRHEWNELHHQRVKHAHRAFGLALLSLIAAAAPLGYYTALSSSPPPLWIQYEFGAAVGSLLLFSFVTYLLVVYHLLGAPGRWTVLASLIWAIGISGWAGLTIGGDLSSYIVWARSGSLNIGGLAGPLTGILAYFFLSYFLLFAAYADAHRRVARGVVPAEVAGTAGPGPT
jgi:uncharacterized membrane protein YidH (DUF202 family)